MHLLYEMCGCVSRQGQKYQQGGGIRGVPEDAEGLFRAERARVIYVKVFKKEIRIPVSEEHDKEMGKQADRMFNFP